MLQTTHNSVRTIALLRHFIVLGLIVATLCSHTERTAAQDVELPQKPLTKPDHWLTNERWSELRYGLTIRQPHDATAVPDTAQGDVMRWALADGTRISLSFARGVYEGVFRKPDGTAGSKHYPAKVDYLKKQISDELKASAGQVINTRADQVIELDHIAGIINYYIVKPHPRLGKPYFYGVALLQLDQLSVAMLKLECAQDNITDAVSTFECMVNSIEVEEAKAVNQRLHGWLQNGEAMLADLTQKKRQAAMRDDRLYRVLEDGKDIGYTRIWQRVQDNAYYKNLKAKRNKDAGPLQGIDGFEVQGNAIFVQARLKGDGISYERLHEAIDAFDQKNAYWQIKNTLRYNNDPNNLRAGTWVETGIRGIAMIDGKRTDHLQITREGTPPRRMVEYILKRERDPERKLRYPSADPRSYPSGEVVEKAWPTPKRAFLSPVDAALMPTILPREEKTYAFAAYHPESTRIDIRMMRVKPNNDGGKTVYLRPVLDQSEQVLTFDFKNELVKWTFPDGRSLKRTTREELARIWGVRLRD